ncbi:hypothetical protein ACOSQ3_021991 [Xanthoceras sorbifolium]
MPGRVRSQVHRCWRYSRSSVGFRFLSGFVSSSRYSRVSFVVGIRRRRDKQTVAGIGGAQRNNNGGVEAGVGLKVKGSEYSVGVGNKTLKQLLFKLKTNIIRTLSLKN